MTPPYAPHCAVRRFAGLLLPVLIVLGLLTACSGPEDNSVDPTATPSVPLSVATATSVPPVASVPPTSPAAPTPTVATPTATAVPSPTPTPSPTATATPTLPPLPSPIPSPTPPIRPADQTVDLPAVTAHYTLVIDTLDVDSGYVHANQTIAVSATSADGTLPETLYLQVVPQMYGFFALEGVAIDGVVITPEQLHGGFTLALDLSAIAADSAIVELTFALNVSLVPDGWGVVSLDSGILRLGNWFPIISTDHGPSTTLDPAYTAVGSYDVFVTVSPDIVLATSGELTASTNLDNGLVERQYSAINMRDFAIVASRDFRVVSATTNSGVAVEVYSVNATAAQEARLLQVGVDAMNQMDGLVGPYPYPSVRIVDVGPSMPAGVEFPGLIYVNPAYQPLDRLIYHELAHQWFYGIIGTRTLVDGWVDEGGAEFFERGLPTGFTELAPLPDGGFPFPLDATIDELPAEPWDAIYRSIYEQGQLFYMAVLTQMGNDAFWSSLRALYTEFAFGTVTAWDMLVNWQLHSPNDLRPLFSDTFRYDWIAQLPEPGGVD